MSTLQEKGKLWLVLSVAFLAVLGLGLFGGVAVAGMHRDHAGMMSGMQMSGMQSMMGGQEDMSAMMQAMDEMIAEMHPEMPAEKRAGLVGKCRNAMASMMGQHHGRTAP